MALLIRTPEAGVIDPQLWKNAISALLPDLDIRIWPEIGDPAEVQVLLAQRGDAEMFASLRNLKLMQQFSAGADAVLKDPVIPRDLPVARLVDPQLANTMSLFVLAAVLRYHRQLDEYQRQQAGGVWKRLPVVGSDDKRVGVMGLGALGSDLASKLVALGFRVSGWSRSSKQLEGVACHHGTESLSAFLASSEILVCLLPLTAETRGILNEDLLARLPRGAYLINVGRGEHHVVADVVEAVDSGQLAGALLDVHSHDPEPPPADSPLWNHPRIDITPHVATLSSARAAAGYVAENIRRVRAGLEPLNLVDRRVGY